MEIVKEVGFITRENSDPTRIKYNELMLTFTVVVAKPQNYSQEWIQVDKVVLLEGIMDQSQELIFNFL